MVVKLSFPQISSSAEDIVLAKGRLCPVADSKYLYVNTLLQVNMSYNSLYNFTHIILGIL